MSKKLCQSKKQIYTTEICIYVFTELRQSRQSLTATSDHVSRMNYPTSHQHHQPSVTSSRRQRPRSRSRDHQSALQRPGSRYSTAGSTHTLNNYCDTSDNWTDHDMDIYMARNPTTRGGLVPLWNSCRDMPHVSYHKIKTKCSYMVHEL